MFNPQRCYKPANINVVKHHFLDAGEKCYDQYSYLRMTDVSGQVFTTLIMAKSRVSPMKIVTIPILELTAALVSVSVSTFLRKELRIDISKEVE